MTETSLVKIRITEDMIGRVAYIATTEEVYSLSEWGEPVACVFKPRIDARSLEQLNLYWACCQLVAENLSDNINFNTKKKVDRQCKFALRFFDDESKIHVNIRDGESRVYFELASISFDKLKRKEANEYFADAFSQLAEFIGCSEEEIVTEAKARMQTRWICKLCGGRATDKHHLFSNTKQNRELYGKLMDDPANIVYLCNDCHLNKPIPKMTEVEFCKALGIEIRSKSGRGAA